MLRWLRLKRGAAVASAEPSADTSRRAQGTRVEESVAQWLSAQGLRELERNYQIRGGELDLIMADQEVVAFVEVRFRLHGGIQAALESVGRHKRTRLLRAANHYLQHNPRAAARPCRFDVVGVENAAAGYAYRWIKDAFRVDES